MLTDNWFARYIASVAELNRMLGLRFVWDGYGYTSVGARTPIGESILMAGIFHNKGDYSQRNVEIAKLSMLAKHLKTIEKYDNGLLDTFKKIVRDTSKNWGTYFGVRLEINIAASLIEKKVGFFKTESPDFTIKECGVYIECASIHRSNAGTAKLVDKIRSVIAVKSRKAYCNPSTALCVDITNVSATTDESENELLASRDGMRGIVKQIFKETESRYGSIMLFSYFMDLNSVFYSGYCRFDNEGMISALADFLDRCYPLGEFRTGPGWTPKAG